MNIDIYNFNLITIAQYCFFILYLTFIILICGIDKETRKIDKLVSIYGIVISILYMVYLCIVEKASIYRYGIYLMLYIIILIYDNITLRKYAKSSYTTGILLMLITMIFFTEEYITANAIIVTLLAMAIYTLIIKLKNKDKEKAKEKLKILDNISIGFYLGFSNILIFILILFYNYIV